MVTELVALKRWQLRIILVGVLFDLGVSAALAGNSLRTTQNQRNEIQLGKVTACWDRVLDEAIHITIPTRTTKARLQAEGNHCASLKIPGIGATTTTVKHG